MNPSTGWVGRVRIREGTAAAPLRASAESQGKLICGSHVVWPHRAALETALESERGSQTRLGNAEGQGYSQCLFSYSAQKPWGM